MISAAIILTDYLIDQGLFTLPSALGNWPLYISSMPDTDEVKSDLGTIYDTVGVKDGRLMTSGENIFHYGNQVRIRSKVYEDGWNKAQAVVEEMESIDSASVTVDAVTYSIENVTQIGTITPLGVEPGTKRRELFTVNFMVTIKEVV